MAGELRWDKAKELLALAATIAAQALSQFGWLEKVIDFFDPTGGLPAGPAVGARYISAATASGWQKDHIYDWNGTSWTDYAPSVMDAVSSQDDLAVYVWNGSAWVGISSAGTHNSLAGKQGGSVPLDEFYHLTAAVYNALVTGPASAVTARIATFNGTTGKIIQDGGSTIGDLQLRSEKDQINGYLGLDGSALIPDAKIPSGITRDTEVPDINARVKVRKNTGADVGTRRRLNLIEGSNVTLTVADDAGNEEVDVTIASTGGGVGFNDAEGDPVDTDKTATADGTSTYAARRDHRHFLGAHTASHKHGGTDEVASATPAANTIPKTGATTVLDSWVTANAVAGTASLRQLGTGATDACAGNDSRLTNARTPTAHAATHQNGGGDEVASSTPATNTIPKTAGVANLDSWISDGSTTVKGKVELATDGEATSGVAVQGNDARLSNARTPTAHLLGGSEHTADTLANLNAKISDADAVAFAGQIGGTPASPDIRGLRETGGPTLLTMGAVVDGEFLKRVGSNIVSGAAGGGSSAGAFGITIDGGGSAISTGSKGYIVVPFSGTITGWTILGNASGSIVVDIKKATYAAFPTTASIAGTEKPTLASAQKNQDLTLTTWTTSVTAGDIIEFVVDSSSTVTRVNVAILVTKS